MTEHARPTPPPETPSTPRPDLGRELARVALGPDVPTFEDLRYAVYAEARSLFQRGEKIRLLVLGREIFEILDRRLVFRTAAHKGPPHVITPYGNLLVMQMDPQGEDEALTFLILG